MDAFCGEFRVISFLHVELASQDARLASHDVKVVLDAPLSYVLIIFDVHDMMVDEAFSLHDLKGVEDVEVFLVFVVQIVLVVAELVSVLFFVKFYLRFPLFICIFVLLLVTLLF